MFISIIVHHSVMTGDGHNHGTCGHNLQPAIGSDTESNIAVGIGVGELVSIQIHRINTLIYTGCSRLYT